MVGKMCSRVVQHQRHLGKAHLGLRFSVPPKMTSSILAPRRPLALCSPMTQRMASEMLDLPEPLGPTMAVMSSPKFSDRLVRKGFEPLNGQTF